MKKCTIILLTSVLAFAGCNKENTVPNVSHKYPVFSCEMEEVTKTGLGADNTVLWTADDRVAVFNETTGLQQYKANAGGSSTTELTAVGEPATGTDINAKVAFYPYSSEASCSESESTFTVSTSVPAEQVYKTGSFGEGAAPMMAVISPDAEDQNKFNFRNVFGCLKLQFTGAGSVKSITVQGNNNEALAGNIAVSMKADGIPTYKFAENPSTSVTLNCGDGVALSETVTPFYISLPCGEYSKGIKLTVTMADETSRVIATGGKLVVGRSAIQPMDACKLVNVEPEQLDQTKFKIEFCNSCLAYLNECYAHPVYDVNSSNKQESGVEVPIDEGAYAKYGSTRKYNHTPAFYGTMGNHSPKNLINGSTSDDKLWSSLRTHNGVIYGTLCQDSNCKETGFDDYDYTYPDFHSFGGRRRQTAIVVDMKEAYNVASIGLFNFNRTGGDGVDYGHIQSVEFYVSNDAEFKFTPAFGSNRKDYDYSNYANPNENNWTLIGKNTNLPVSKSEIQWVDVPYSLIVSGNAKGRFLKIVFLANRTVGNDGAAAYSARELYVKKATNLD